MTIDEFKKVELRVGKVLEAERVEGSEKLIKMKVDVGEKDAEGLPVTRQVLAGIGKAYAPETLIGKEIIVVANLDPRMMMGLESQGMLLAANGTDGPVVLMPEQEVPPGASIQ